MELIFSVGAIAAHAGGMGRVTAHNDAFVWIDSRPIPRQQAELYTALWLIRSHGDSFAKAYLPPRKV